MISFLLKTHSNEESLSQPNLIRLRYARRAPLNSERFNLEASLFALDISILYQNLNAFSTSIQQDLSIVNNGSSDLLNITLSNDATPSSVTLKSLESLTQKLQGFSNRLEILEKGLS